MLEVNRQYRDGHIDYHRYRNDSRAEANHRQRAAEQFRIGAQRRIEGGMRNPPLREAVGEAREVVRLRPSGFEEKIADEKTNQQRRQPSDSIAEFQRALGKLLKRKTIDLSLSPQSGILVCGQLVTSPANSQRDGGV